MSSSTVISDTLKWLTPSPTSGVFVLQVGMSRPLRKLIIGIDKDGKMTVKSKTWGTGWSIRKISLEPSPMRAIESKLASIDWRHVSMDKTKGFDGDNVTLKWRGHKARLWTPECGSHQRGLTGIIEIIAHLYQLAGLEKNGLLADQP